MQTIIGGDELSEKRPVGRPFSENPKLAKVSVRIDAEEKEILDDYCKRTNISQADGVRKGIRCLKKQK